MKPEINLEAQNLPIYLGTHFNFFDINDFRGILFKLPIIDSIIAPRSFEDFDSIYAIDNPKAFMESALELLDDSDINEEYFELILLELIHLILQCGAAQSKEIYLEYLKLILESPIIQPAFKTFDTDISSYAPSRFFKLGKSYYDYHKNKADKAKEVYLSLP